MTIFWFACALMSLAAVAFVLWPLIAKHRIETDQKNINLALGKLRINEWQTALQNKEISEKEFYDLSSDVEDTLLVNLDLRPIVTSNPAPISITIALGFMIPIVAGALYLHIGAPAALAPGHSDTSLTRDQKPSIESSPQSVEAMLKQLKSHLTANPNDEHGWSILAQAMMSSGRYSEAVNAYEELLRLLGRESQILVLYANALAMSAGGNFKGFPVELLREALSIDPLSLEALWLSGVAAEKRSDHYQALSHWYQLEPLVAKQPGALTDLRARIKNSEQRMLAENLSPPDRPIVSATIQTVPALDSEGLRIRIDIEPKLLPLLLPDDVLFLYARAKNVSRPVAALRHPVSQWPVEFILGNSASIMTDTALLSFDVVEIGAHISRTGNALINPGDFVAATVKSEVGNRDLISITISKIRP